MPYDRNNPHPDLGDYGGNYGYAVGDKYDRQLPITEIAKRVRTEIKEAIKAGTLPALKASVRIDRFSGGQSLDARISDVSVPVLNEARLAEELRVGSSTRIDGYEFPHYNVTGVHILDTIKGIIAAYNYDRSDSQTDFFNVNFYTSTDFAWEWERDEKARVRERLQGGMAPTLSADSTSQPTGLAPALGSARAA